MSTLQQCVQFKQHVSSDYEGKKMRNKIMLCGETGPMLHLNALLGFLNVGKDRW